MYLRNRIESAAIADRVFIVAPDGICEIESKGDSVGDEGDLRVSICGIELKGYATLTQRLDMLLKKALPFLSSNSLGVRAITSKPKRSGSLSLTSLTLSA